MASTNLSKVGLESKNFVDNLCGEFVTKKILLKIKSITLYYNQESILAIFPFYNNAEADQNVKNSPHYHYFTTTFLEKAHNNKKIEESFKKEIVSFEPDEFIEIIEALVNNQQSSNEGEIYGVIIITNKRKINVGKIKYEKNSFISLKKIKIENEFIIGLKTCYDNKHNKELETNIPTLFFIKIYTEKNLLRNNFYKETSYGKFCKYFNYITNIFTILILIISFILSYYYVSQNIYKGVLTLNKDKNSSNIFLSLDYPSKLHTDEHGFVHIKSETVEDAFFTLGIAHSRDRLWQMDFVRRLARGKLSEILGEKALRVDRMMRNIGINEVAIKDTEEFLNTNNTDLFRRVNKYVEAINFYANEHFLPPEYQILNIKFDNWTVTDTLAYLRFLTFTVSVDYPLELFNNILENQLGKDYNDLIRKVSYGNFLYSNRTVVSHEELEKYNKNLTTGTNFFKKTNNEKKNNEKEKTDLEEEIKLTEDFSYLKDDPIVTSDILNLQASNSWAVSGNYTSTGKPIFSNDPHLSNSIPSIHYIVKLYIGNITDQQILVGSSPPGLPFFMVGSNKYLAWGITTDNRDVSDLCEEKLDADDLKNSNFYFIGDDILKLKEIEEVIKIKGGKEEIIKVKYTKNGPIIEEFIKEISIFGVDYKYKKKEENIGTDKGPNALSLRIITFTHKNLIFFQHDLNFAKKKEDFLKNIDHYGGPLLALTWATVDNEIGYTSIGQIPIKDNKESIFCKGYVTDTESIDVIKGFIPRNETPIIINPEKGFIVTANNKQMPDTYIHYSQSYAYFNRFFRITELIENKIHKNFKKFDINDNLEILSDVYDIYAANIIPKIIKIIERNFNLITDSVTEENTNKYLSYLNTLKQFDYFFYKNSTAATLYSVFEYHLGKNLLLQNIENNVFKGFINEIEARGIMNNFNYWNFINEMVENIEKNENIPDIENCRFYKPFSNCEGYIIDTFEKLDIFLIQGDYLDKNGEIKKWGDVHFHYYPHAFDGNFLLKKFFSRKISTDGNRYTVKVSKTKFHDVNNGPFTSTHSANLKFISDLSDITRPYIIIDTGNSGNILTKFYDNLMEKSENNELIKIKDHEFNDDVHLLISFPEHNTLIIRND